MKIRAVPLIALWLIVLGLWAVVLLRSPQSSGSPRLPALGPTPGVTVPPAAPPGVSPTPSPRPEPLQAGPVGAAPATGRTGSTVDAEDLREGDVEDEASRPATASGSAAGGGVTITLPSVSQPAAPAVHVVGNAPIAPLPIPLLR